eukprot:scaffold351_cov162-Ochromonas_danica.AAC.26
MDILRPGVARRRRQAAGSAQEVSLHGLALLESRDELAVDPHQQVHIGLQRGDDLLAQLLHLLLQPALAGGVLLRGRLLDNIQFLAAIARVSEVFLEEEVLLLEGDDGQALSVDVFAQGGHESLLGHGLALQRLLDLLLGAHLALQVVLLSSPRVDEGAHLQQMVGGLELSAAAIALLSAALQGDARLEIVADQTGLIALFFHDLHLALQVFEGFDYSGAWLGSPRGGGGGGREDCSSGRTARLRLAIESGVFAFFRFGRIEFGEEPSIAGGAH